MNPSLLHTKKSHPNTDLTNMRLTFAVLLSLLLLQTTYGAGEPNPIQLPTGGRLSGFIFNCKSWRLAVEVNNTKHWDVVPAQCTSYVGEYMVNKTSESQYACDCTQVVQEALSHLNSLTPSAAGTDTWVFDLTDTLLSTVEYYGLPDVNWGGLPFNWNYFNYWLPAGNLPAVPGISQLYSAVKAKGLKIVILSGNSEDSRDLFEEKLKKAGFADWDQFILKDQKIATREFKELKREQLLKDGYKVIGNVGDQWIDLVGGDNVGSRIFKLPNPMYHVK